MIRDDLSYRDYFRPLCALVLLVTTTPAVRDGSSPEVVAAVIVRALCTHRPRTRYLIGKGHRPHDPRRPLGTRPDPRPAPHHDVRPAHHVR